MRRKRKLPCWSSEQLLSSWSLSVWAVVPSLSPAPPRAALVPVVEPGVVPVAVLVAVLVAALVAVLEIEWEVLPHSLPHPAQLRVRVGRRSWMKTGMRKRMIMMRSRL